MTVIYEKRETNDMSSMITSFDYSETFQILAEGARTQVDSRTLLELKSQSWKPRRPKQLEFTGQSTAEKGTAQRRLERSANGIL